MASAVSHNVRCFLTKNMATDKMLLLNLKGYTQYAQLPSNSHPERSPVPSTLMIINRLRYCTTYKSKLLTCSSSTSNVSRFLRANTMAASSETLPISTTDQPIYKANQTTLDAGSSLLFVVKNILNHAAHKVDTALRGTKDYLEKLDEKVSKANVSPRLLCTIKQFFAMDKEIALSELLVLAQKISVRLNLQEVQKVLCNRQIIETPKQIVKAFTGLISVDDNLQPAHTDNSTNKMISIVMANDPLRKEKVKHQNALAFRASPEYQNHASRPVQKNESEFGKPPGLIMYTFYYASKNEEWLNEFDKNAKAVTTHHCIENSKKIFSIELFKIADHVKEEEVQHLSKKEGWHNKCPEFFHKDDQFSTGRFVLVRNDFERVQLVLQGRGTKILKALGDFEGNWKKDLKIRGFEHSLLDYYKKLPLS